MDKREARETHESSVRKGSKNNPPTLTFSSLELHYPPSDKNSLEDVQIKIVYKWKELLTVLELDWFKVQQPAGRKFLFLFLKEQTDHIYRINNFLLKQRQSHYICAKFKTKC